MVRPAFLACLALGLALSACVAPPESRVGLSEPGETAYDPRLVGLWALAVAGPEGRGQGYLLDIAAGDDVLDITGIGVGYGGGEPVRWFGARAHASEIDGRTYYNVQRVAGAGADWTGPGEEPGFIIVRLRLAEDGGLFISVLDPQILAGLTAEALVGVIEEGRSWGREVEGSYRGDDVGYLFLDLSRPELVALIRKVTPEKLFTGEVGPFLRLGPPAGDDERIERRGPE